MGSMGKKMSSFFLTNYTIILLLLFALLLLLESFSLDSSLGLLIFPIKTYENLDILENQKQIIKENRGYQPSIVG
jgi:hypothetical protein